MEKNKVVKELSVIFWLFVIGSILGYIMEMIVVLFQKGYFESRSGLIYGPFTPVYGFGIVIYYLILNNIKTDNKIKVFLITMIIGGITEYMCSFIQEKLFGTISWDYSNLIFNVNGRTSLLHCAYWGTAGVLYVTYIYPVIEKLKNNIDNSNLKIITVMAVSFMMFNVGISYAAANRQTERRNNILPGNEFDMFLDRYYPDDYMDRVYANKKEMDR